MTPILTVDNARCADVRFQDGALPSAIGVKSFQVLRANREHPQEADGFGWTYNHAPMLCCYHGRLYVEYLSSPVSEHEAPGQTLLTHSENGMDWSFPRVVFPPIRVPLAPYQGPRAGDMPPFVQSVPHQRMGFYRASNDVLLVMSFYGIVHDRRISAPCDGWGVGRAVRRVFSDGALGDIHFLLYNEPAGYTEKTADMFPHFSKSADEAFVFACREALSDGALVRQMYEEQRFDGALFQSAGDEALSFYTVSPDEMIGVYKRGRASVSHDNGKTWSAVSPNPTVRTATGKVWGQRTSDGRFALFYNPTTDGQHRWPIAVVTGSDGHAFGDMLGITGYMSPPRYGGLDKNLGPQYLRGICERNPQTPDGCVWLAYSNNKEDIWVSRVPVPIAGRQADAIDETFEGAPCLPEAWNVYSPLYAPVRAQNGALTLTDRDPYDRAVLQRALRPQSAGVVDIALQADAVCRGGAVCVQLQDDRGSVPVQVSFRADGKIYVRAGGRSEARAAYPFGERLTLSLRYDCEQSAFSVRCAQLDGTFAFSAVVNEITRVVIATKELCQIPYATVDTVGKYGTSAQVLPGAGERTPPTRARVFAFRAH